MVTSIAVPVNYQADLSGPSGLRINISGALLHPNRSLRPRRLSPKIRLVTAHFVRVPDRMMGDAGGILGYMQRQVGDRVKLRFADDLCEPICINNVIRSQVERVAIFAPRLIRPGLVLKFLRYPALAYLTAEPVSGELGQFQGFDCVAFSDYRN